MIGTKSLAKTKLMKEQWPANCLSIGDSETNLAAYFFYSSRTWCSPKAHFFSSTINACPASISDLGDPDQSIPVLDWYHVLDSKPVESVQTGLPNRRQEESKLKLGELFIPM